MSLEADYVLAREALTLEREAAARYVEHAAISVDPRLVAYWESLRRNESGHRALLEEWLRDNGAHADDEPREVTGGAGDSSAAGAAGRAVSVRGYARELARLDADFAFEDAAVKRYGELAVAASDPSLKALFKDLARGEAGHRRGLRNTIAAVEDPARPVLLFCPLCGWELDFGLDPPEGAEAKCRMCPGRFALHLDDDGDWTLERLAP